ncbi:MAG: phage holin family protein [Dehalococcoidia bacterium]
MPEFIVVGGGGNPRSNEGKLVAFVVRWLITAAAVWVAAQIVSGIHLEGWKSTLFVALVLGLLNAYLKPLLVLGSLPALVMTLGIFLIFINTALLALTAWFAGKFDAIHFDIDGFWSAFFGAIIISIVSFFISLVVKPGKIARSVAR